MKANDVAVLAPDNRETRRIAVAVVVAHGRRGRSHSATQVVVGEDLAGH